MLHIQALYRLQALSYQISQTCQTFERLKYILFKARAIFQYSSFRQNDLIQILCVTIDLSDIYNFSICLPDQISWTILTLFGKINHWITSYNFILVWLQSCRYPILQWPFFASNEKICKESSRGKELLLVGSGPLLDNHF